LPCFICCKDKLCVALPIEEVGEDSAMTLDEVVRRSFLFSPAANTALHFKQHIERKSADEEK